MEFRKFDFNDQMDFAKLSGDYNPMHTNIIYSRRLLFGSPVVHGIHLLLWSLDSCLENRGEYLEIELLDVVFNKPIKLEEEVSMSIRNEDENFFLIDLANNQTVAATIEVKFRRAMRHSSGNPINSSPEKLDANDLTDEEIEVASGNLDLYLDKELAARMFPNLMRCIPILHIAVITATSRLVGMHCPGLNSLFSELELSTTSSQRQDIMDYAVEKFDKRFGMVRIRISAPEIKGKIVAFRRPAPKKQADFLTLRNLVERNEFIGQRALIIGGSRGLGEVAAKLLCGGGAKVKITYYKGKEDAQRVIDDIVSNGAIADSFFLDILNPKITIQNTSPNKWIPTHLYYFATPFIFSGVSGRFSNKLFSNFCDYYVTGFVNILDQTKDFDIRHIFYPSTIAIEELPNNMGEYVAAKIAGEALCSFLEKNNPHLKIHRPRFPRLATDQTNSIFPVANQDPAPILLNELRKFRDLIENN